jgi:septal ring factor EnvC (AmiA/AmiB activator)
MHRVNLVGRKFRQIAYQAGRFEALEHEPALNLLKQDLDRLDKALDDHIVALDQIGREVSLLRRDINKLQAAEIKDLGFEDQDEVLERLSRLYNLWPAGEYRSNDGVW